MAAICNWLSLMNSDKWLLIKIMQTSECSKNIHLQEFHENIFQTDVKAYPVVLMEPFSETSFRTTLFLYYLSFYCLWSIIQKEKSFD